jgi:3-demethoxyubiquinol 3-hydroxylase
LDRLPLGDVVSREIVERMRQEEHAHAVWAVQQGGSELAWPVRAAMRLSAKLMTRVAHYL